MRYIFIFAIAFACSTSGNKYAVHGEKIKAEGAMSTEEFLSVVSENEENYKVQGTIEEVCQMKGCWMTLKNDKGENVRVTFKDYGFFVPKDISGREVIVEGVAKRDKLDEEVARHYAEDGGKEYDESMTNTVSFVAHGVLVKEG